MTSKHINNHNLEYLEQKNTEYPFICKYCDKGYNVRNSLWYHEKKCVVKNEDENIILDNNLTKNSSEVVHLTNLVFKLMTNNEEIQKKQNEFQKQTLDMQQQTQDIQKQMIDVCKTSGTNNTYNNNSNNKTFNMQVFLNEKCKDAMNIMDFVNSMTLQLSDLEDVGELGYVENR